MEPMVLFAAGVVVYYWYRTVLDARDELRRERAAFLLEAALTQKAAALEGHTVTHVVGLEKLSRILAARNKRHKRDEAAIPMVWRQGVL